MGSPVRKKSLKASSKSLESWIWDAAYSIRGAKDAPKYRNYILPLIFTKRLCDIFDDELNRIAAEVCSRKKAFQLVRADHKLVRFYLPFAPEDPEQPVWSVNRYFHNQRLGLIVDLDMTRLSKRYLFHVFNLPHLRVEVAKTSTSSKVKHTSPTKLRAVKVGIPPTVDEQEEIASALAATQQKINVAVNKKTQLQDLFGTLLHELMTAKTRVHDLEFSL